MTEKWQSKYLCKCQTRKGVYYQEFHDSITANTFFFLQGSLFIHSFWSHEVVQEAES